MELSGHRNDDLYHAAIPVSGIRSSRIEEDTIDSSHFEDHVEVEITNCPNLPWVEGLEELGGLKYLRINECPSLERVDFRTPRHNSSSYEDKANMPQPEHSLDYAGEDSAEELFWLEQLNLCIEAYPEKKLL